MSGLSGLSGVDRVLAMRTQILERNEALQRANAQPTTPSGLEVGGIGVGAAKPDANGFGATLEAALRSVNQSQHAAKLASEAYERGDTVDVAKVMLARQEASIAFEATLQVRNKLLSAYKDIMSMPV